MRLQDQLQIIRAHQTRAPVPVVKVANSLGIGVFSTESWDDGVSGKIERRGSGFEIVINANHPEVRRRFTIAHEIAHAVLHQDLIGDGIEDDAQWRSGLADPIEYQANRMAADILMPEHLLQKYLDRGVNDPAYLAHLFKVSKKSMEIRLETMGVLA
jgi:Zn-dependent peptidase ImmA (M78 family)